MLSPGRTLSVGRSSDCSLTIPSQRVSRRHAEIRWREGIPVVCDLDSQNGTLINGRRIKGEHKLNDGDELEFGPYLCTFRCTTETADLQSSSTMAHTRPMIGDAMAGRLDQVSLTELLQSLAFNKKTGTLEIFGGDDGSIVVRDGVPTYARAGRELGEEAIYRLVGITHGQFSFSPEITEKARNINKPMESLLVEAARRQDER